MPSDRRHIYHEVELVLSIRIDKKTADHISGTWHMVSLPDGFPATNACPSGVHS